MEEKIEINQIAVADVMYDTLFINTNTPFTIAEGKYEIKLHDAGQLKSIAKLLVENYHRFLEIETAMKQWETARNKLLSRLDCVK